MQRGKSVGVQEGPTLVMLLGDRIRMLGPLGPVTIVRSWDATSVERERALDMSDSRDVIWRVCRDAENGQRRDLCDIHRLVETSGEGDSRISTAFLARRVLDAVEREMLLVVDGWETGGHWTTSGRRRSGRISARAVGGTVEERKLIANIEAYARNGLRHAGQTYRLASDASADGPGVREGWEVVPRAEALRILDGLSQQPHQSAELAALLKEAAGALTKDWRPPLTHPHGLILLRQSQARSEGAAPDVVAISPSKLRALAEQATLEIHVVDLNGKPQKDLAFEIEMPDGGTERGKLDQAGRGRAQSSQPGTFVVGFPDLDAADWEGDGAIAPPETERSEARRHKVVQGERLPTIARKAGFARWQTVWEFAANSELRTGRGDAHILLPGDELSIPTRLERKAEVPGGKAEYVVLSSTELLRVRLAEHAFGNEAAFRATPDTGDEVFEGELAEDGTAEIDLPTNARKVNIELFCGEDEKPFGTYELDLGEMDPHTEISGVQQRLANLGYYRGPLDGALNDTIKSAVARFRREWGLPPSDQIDEDLRRALVWVHDLDDDVSECIADQTVGERSQSPQGTAGSDSEAKDGADGDEEPDDQDHHDRKVDDLLEWLDEDWESEAAEETAT